MKENPTPKEKQKEYDTKLIEDLKQNAYDSITSNEIIDRKKWDQWCERIKRSAEKYSYSGDFTNDAIFEMMSKGCFYCGGIAITIDRLDSKLDHTLNNCVGSCHECNISKGPADPATFIRKAYFRVHKEYVDDDHDIWFINKNKPTESVYKIPAKKKGVPYELSKEDFDTLIRSDCAYCTRSSSTWFGIDRVIPSLGYTNDNVTPCCWDCNLDKSKGGVDMTKMRNERIAKRIETGELIIYNCDKVILHRGTVTSKKV